MITIVYIIVFFVAGWKLGRKYQDFQDLMLARRVSKLVVQREQLAKDKTDYERYEEVEKRINGRAKRDLDLADREGELL